MTRLTKKIENQYIIECPNLLNYIDGKNRLNELLSTQNKGIQKLGQLEDILEKYEVDDLNVLDQVLENQRFLSNHDYSTLPREDFDCLFKSLNRYKDIEEELGIDLIILAKGIKNGIYVKQGKKILKKKIKDIRYSKDLTVHYELNGKRYGKTGAIMILYGDYNSQYCDFTNVYTYGRNWALTKEELI